MRLSKGVIFLRRKYYFIGNHHIKKKNNLFFWRIQFLLLFSISSSCYLIVYITLSTYPAHATTYQRVRGTLIFLNKIRLKNRTVKTTMEYNTGLWAQSCCSMEQQQNTPKWTTPLPVSISCATISSGNRRGSISANSPTLLEWLQVCIMSFEKLSDGSGDNRFQYNMCISSEACMIKLHWNFPPLTHMH